jgi:hypothetical protein
MIYRPASSQPRRAGRGIPHTRRTLTTLSGLVAFITAAIGFAPAASAIRLPPPGGGGAPPPPPPATTVATHFPLWAVIAMVAATVVLSVATTLITLALDHMHRARRTPAAGAEPWASGQTPPAIPQPQPEQGEILTSHLGDYEIHRADRG